MTLDARLARAILTEFADVREAPVPKTVGDQARCTVRVSRLLPANGSVLLYGDTGVGKTVQALLVALWMAAQKRRPCLVLAPKAEVRDERWLTDGEALAEAITRLRRRRPDDPMLRKLARARVEPIYALDGRVGAELAGRTVVALATKPAFGADALKARTRREREDFFNHPDLALVVLDEAHRASGAGTLTGDLLRALLAPAPPEKWSVSLLSLTATPIRQQSGDLLELIGANLSPAARDELRPVGDFHKTAHTLVRRSWNPNAGALTPTQLSYLAQQRRAAKAVLDQHVVRERPNQAQVRLPEKHHLVVDEQWGKIYGLARVLPALLQEILKRRGPQERLESGDDAAKAPRPSDAYRRMLLSSSAAFWVTPPGKALRNRQDPASRELVRLIDDHLGPPGGGIEPSALLRHPKVAWTVEHALAAAAHRQVLVFVEYLSTSAALVEALQACKPPEITIGTPNDHGLAADFQKHTSGMVMVATPKHQEAVEFDLADAAGIENERMLIHHDLPWTSVALRQRHGRLQRVRRDFPAIVALAPVLALPDDQRLWRTVSGRFDATDFIDAAFALPERVSAFSERVPSPDDLDPTLRKNAQLG